MAGLDSGSSDSNYRSVGDCESGFSSPENTRANEFQVENSDPCSTGTPSLLNSPRMVHNPFAVKVDAPTRSMADSTDHKELRPILAPATLVLGKCTTETESVGNNVSSSFRLKPPLLNNPFLKVDPSSSTDKKLDSSEVSTTSENVENMYPDTGQESESSCSSAGPSSGPLRKTSLVLAPSTRELNANSQQIHEDADCEDDRKLSSASSDNLVPQSSFSQVSVTTQSHIPTISSNLSAAPAVQSSGFVFGQNMDERVVNAKSRNCVMNGTAGLFSSSSENGVDEERLFHNSSIPLTFVERQQNENHFDSSRQPKSLSESAQEYEARQVKRTYEEVAIVTGEEDESNVLQMNCKLFKFDKVTSGWIEKGRCLLRLNDKESEDNTIHSRLVARTQGSLRVILNTKVWSGMTIDRPSTNSIRFSVVEGDEIRIFLVTGSTKDADQLFGALDWRITTLKSAEDRKSSGEGCSYMSIGSSGGAVADETISSSGTSPASPLDVAMTASASNVGFTIDSVSTSAPLTETLGSKKRRISPPSASDDDDNLRFLGAPISTLEREEAQLIDDESCVSDSQVQDRIVDSTDNNDSNSVDEK